MNSKCLFPQWPGRSGIQFFCTGMQMRASAKKLPKPHRKIITPTIVVHVRKMGCTKIFRKSSKIHILVTAMIRGCRRPVV